METVLAAAITGVLTFAGVVVTARSTRRATTQQHVEQTEHLVGIRQDVHNLNSRVDSLSANHEVLFNMVAEVDAKVTKPVRKKVVTDSEKVYG